MERFGVVAVFAAGLAAATAAIGGEAPAAGESPVRVAEALCDARVDPVGVDPAAVRFSW